MAEITGATPPALAARRAIEPWLLGYVEAFNRLSASRAVGAAGPLPIALSEIESYCRLFGWTGIEEAAELVEIVQAMDAAYLAVAYGRAMEDSFEAQGTAGVGFTERVPRRGNPDPVRRKAMERDAANT